eukprot:gnl/Dysnectes_brevis/2734_a3322_961.p1 GENE.gnl/Dysnectes_brevis/2734_a3322_961~~gnl/Dysnectes_brevis/2734_a3322_961.p1  ORF type:complete len:246 (-),score=74.01 gnl/Dysnectes_brevis/2734_a3322_961:104-841(-)
MISINTHTTPTQHCPVCHELVAKDSIVSHFQTTQGHAMSLIERQETMERELTTARTQLAFFHAETDSRPASATSREGRMAAALSRFSFADSDSCFDLEAGDRAARKSTFSTLRCAKPGASVEHGVHQWVLRVLRIDSYATVGVAAPGEIGCLPGRAGMPRSIGIDADDGSCHSAGGVFGANAWSYGAGDLLTVRLDLTAGTVTWLKNGSGAYTRALPAPGSAYTLAVGLYNRQDAVQIESYAALD